MEYSNAMPEAYRRFDRRRAMWKELGMRREDELPSDVYEAEMFLELETLHPHRFKKAKGNGS